MPEIDPQWWTAATIDGESMPDVLARHDFAKVFKFLRRRGWSAYAIASAINRDIKMVSGILEGKRRVSHYALIEAIVSGLRIPAHMCGMSSTPPGGVDDSPRQMLQRLLARGKVLDRHTVEVFADHTWQVCEVDRLEGSTVAGTQLETHIAALQDRRDHCVSRSVRQRLDEVLSDALVLSGWLALDRGELDVSWRLHERAKDCAGGLQAPRSHAMAQQSYLLLEAGEPRQACDFARMALTEAGTAVPSLLRAWLAAVHAEMAAAAGDANWEQGFLRAQQLLPSHGQDPESPYVMLDDIHLERWRGAAAASISAKDAIGSLEYALSRLGNDWPRARAGAHVDLARAHAGAGHRSEAFSQCRAGRTMAQQVASRRHLIRAHRLRRVLDEATV